MRKHSTKLLLGLLLLIFSGVAKSQTNIAAYRFTKTTGTTYTPITGGNVLFTPTYDDNVSAAVNLGGTFVFGGVSYTQCFINSNGYLTFGAASTSSSYTPLSTLGTTTGAISGFGVDGAGSTATGAAAEISYINTGGATGEFIVQYKDHATYGNRAMERLNFQIRLNLSTNAFSIVYGSFSSPGTTSTSYNAQVGARGNSVTWATNVNNLLISNLPAATTCSWADAVTGNSNSSGLAFSANNTNVVPSNGLTYTWSPASTPLPVRTFYAVTNITTRGATITWAPATGATQYNVQYRVPGTCTWTDFSSNPVSDTTATLTDLTAGTTYQVRVQSVSPAGNAIWSHIPTSAAGTGLNGYTTTGTFSTVATCSVPTGVTISSVTTTSASVSFTSTGNNYIVEYGVTGFTPGTGATAGTGGTIVTGAASPIILNSLTAGTTYDVYIRQNCTAAGNGYSSNTTKVTFSTTCAAVASFSENFDGVTAPALPVCFAKVGIGGSAYTQTSDASSSPNTLYIYSFTTSSQAVVALKPVSNAGAGTNQLRFKLRANFTAGDTLQVGYLTDVNDAATFVVLTQIRAASLTYTEYTVLPGTAPGANQYLAFRAKGTSGASMLIDDISWEPIPACPIPSGITINAVTSNSASVSFTTTGSSFIVEYGPTGFTPGTGATAGTGGIIVTGTTSPISITGLTASTTYQVYIRQNCTAAGNGYSANSGATTFTTAATPPANDNASGAITLTVGAGCTGAPYTNVGATLNTAEPYPSCSGVAQAPVWFKFVAPASGAVRVSTDLGTAPTFTDSKVGLFAATDPANYTTFSIISCDDDGGSAIGSGFLSVVYATGLTAGTTYYVAVDKYSSTTTTGTFCIAVDELNNGMLSTTNTCTRPYPLPGSNFNTTYTGWAPLMDSSSLLIALVRNPAGGNVGLYTVGQNVNTGAVRQANGTYYLNRNYRISNTSATNVNVQLFFLNSELTALAAVDPAVTLANLGVTRQTEAPVGCYNDFNAANGAISFIPQTSNGTAGGVNWISFTTPAFSNFYLNRAGTALPITLQYLKGLRTGNGNALTWKVACTSVSITMELERSSDSRTFKAITSITAPQARCGQPFDYVDVAPLKGTNYYRLKMIDVDGTVSYSPIVAIINGTTGAELAGIYPTIVRDEAFLSVAASRSTKMQISITDMSGKVVKTMSQTVANGSTLLNINTANLAAGVYNITGMLDGAKTKTLRFVKQ